MSRGAMQRRVSSGEWEPIGKRVVRIAGARPTWHQRLWTGVLVGGPSAALSRYTALSVLGLRRFVDAPIEVIVPHPRNVRADGIAFHEVTDLLTQHVTTRNGLPVVRADRALVDCSPVLARSRLALAFDDAVIRGLCTPLEVGDRLAQLARPGKRGLEAIASVLDERGRIAVASQSVLESGFLHLIEDFGIERPVTQFPHPAPGRSLEMVDTAWPCRRLITEVDGRSWHTRVQDLLRDQERDLKAAAAGWQVLRLRGELITSDRAGVAHDLAAALAARPLVAA